MPAERPAGSRRSEGRVEAYAASPLFPAAKRIVSAAGFNVMLETEPWRDKHLVVPFPRKFDDQFTRAARRRFRSAAALAAALDSKAVALPPHS